MLFVKWLIALPIMVFVATGCASVSQTHNAAMCGEPHFASDKSLIPSNLGCLSKLPSQRLEKESYVDTEKMITAQRPDYSQWEDKAAKILSKLVAAEQKFPDMTLPKLAKRHETLQKLLAQGKNSDALAELNALAKAVDPRIMADMAALNVEAAEALGYTAHRYDAGTFLQKSNYAIELLKLMGKLPAELLIVHEFELGMFLHNIGKFEESNEHLGNSLDLLISGYATKNAPEWVVPSYYLALNNFFLGNYAQSVTDFTQDRKSYGKDDASGAYNHLNLYFSVSMLNKDAGKEMLSRALRLLKVKDTETEWAANVMKRLIAGERTELIEDASSFASKQTNLSLAELLTEAYYYAGMDYFVEGRVNSARVMWNEAQRLGVYMFIEYALAEQGVQVLAAPK